MNDIPDEHKDIVVIGINPVNLADMMLRMDGQGSLQASIADRMAHEFGERRVRAAAERQADLWNLVR